MRYKIFGRRTGLRVSALALGTGNFGTSWGHGAEREEAKKIFDGYVEAGGNFIDTADGYQGGQSEALVGEFIAADRDAFVVATKYTLGVTAHDGMSQTGNSRKNMVRSIEVSLKRLKTDRIDLYWVHMADGVTPIEEIVRGFDDLVRTGKILYAGLSSFPAWRIARAVTLAEWRGWAPITGIQIEYSLVERTPDRELLPMAEALGLGVALWSPLGGGFLTGKYRGRDEGRLQRLGTLVHTEKTTPETAVLDAVLAVASEISVSPTHVAIAWLLHEAAHASTSLIPILGPRTREQLDATLGAWT
jgi:aryl-alcohol dehydrogenase-like predicted oxidoreductase